MGDMKWLAAIALFSLLPIAYGGKTDAPAVEDSSALRASLAKADALVVHEGLPHHMFEKDLLAKELKRQDVEKIGGYGFYTPAATIPDPAALKELLQSEATLVTFGGEKRCGGFHPDYAVSWKVDQITRQALICFGCHEIIFIEGEKTFRYDLASGKAEKFEDLLGKYTSKRPGKSH